MHTHSAMGMLLVLYNFFVCNKTYSIIFDRINSLFLQRYLGHAAPTWSDMFAQFSNAPHSLLR